MSSTRLPTRRAARATGLALALAFAASVAGAQPSQPAIRILAGYAPGGNVDMLARLIAQRLGDALGRTVVVENKPGGGGQNAAEALKAAAPDGNTLMLAPDAAAVVRPAAMKRPAFNATTDFVAVAETGSQDYGFAIGAAIPAKDVREFAAWARANPGNANFGSAGVGGITHFTGLMIGQAIEAPLVHVPYNGSSPAVNAVVSGQIAATIQPVGTLAAQAKAGKVRVLAVSGTKRSDVFPNAPTFTELGHPSLKVVTWFGLFAPARTPPEIVKRYNEIVVNAMRDPAVSTPIRNLGLDIRELTPAQFGAVVKADAERWSAVIKSSGFTLDSE
jgi:tripartite-type tricarboxylate transporter receptor subunit TctC